MVTYHDVCLRVRTGRREKLIKIGANVVRHAGYIIFQMAEVTVPRRLFEQILEKIRGLDAGLPVRGIGRASP